MFTIVPAEMGTLDASPVRTQHRYVDRGLRPAQSCRSHRVCGDPRNPCGLDRTAFVRDLVEGYGRCDLFVLCSATVRLAPFIGSHTADRLPVPWWNLAPLAMELCW